MRIAAVFNRDSGTLRTMDLEAFCAEAVQVFTKAGHQLDCHVVDGDKVVATLEALSENEIVEAIIAAGGDGTISTAAALALKGNKVLGILPAGTMNLFARALGVPSDIQKALLAVSQGDVGLVDLQRPMANRSFINSASVSTRGWCASVMGWSIAAGSEKCLQAYGPSPPQR